MHDTVTIQQEDGNAADTDGAVHPQRDMLISIPNEDYLAGPRHGNSRNHPWQGAWYRETHRSIKQLIKLLQLYPPALHTRDDDGNYPIYYVMLSKPEAVMSLIRTDPSSILQQRSKGGQTIFHQACSSNVFHVAEQLLFQYSNHVGAVLNSRDDDGNTPLHDACRCGSQEIVDLLLQHPDIDVNVTNHHGDTALHETIRMIYRHMDGYSFPLVVLLLQHPFIDITIMNDNKETPWDVVNNAITEINRRDDNHECRLYVCYFLQMKQIMGTIAMNRKWQSYVYFLQNMVDWSNHETIKENLRLNVIMHGIHKNEEKGRRTTTIGHKTRYT